MSVEAAALYSALQTLLDQPKELAALRAEIATLRQEVQGFRRSMPVQLVTVAEAARRLDLTSKTVRQHVKRGLLRAVRVGDSIRIDLGSLPEALEPTT